MCDEELEGFSETEIESTIKEALELFIDGKDFSDNAKEAELGNMRIATFEDDGVLTMNKGLVLEIGEQKFQITIVAA